MNRSPLPDRPRFAPKTISWPLVAAAIVAIGSAVPAVADVYKWQDANGQWHFGDRPPAHSGSGATAVGKLAPRGTGTRTPASRQQDINRLLDSFAADRREREEARRQARADSQQRKTACAQARARLESVTSASALVVTQPDGSRYYLSTSERERVEGGARERLQSACTHR